MAASSLAIARAVTGGAAALASGRTLLAVLAIASGVALGYAVALINRAAVSELTAGLATLSGQADLQVRGPRSGFNEALYPQLARIDGVAVASPVVDVAAVVDNRSEPLTIVGVDVFRALEINPALVASAGDRLDTLRGDTLFPSAAAAAWLGVGEGDTVTVLAGRAAIPLRIAGIAGSSESSARYAVMDIAAAQDLFAARGRLTRVDLRVAPGRDIDALARRVQAILPPGIVVAPPAEGTAATARLSRAYRVNLDVLALVALFTGSMLVFATQTLALARRRPQLALLRTLGLPRRRLLLVVIAEAALLGVAGAIAGIAAGHALASLALRRFGPDLGAGFFRGTDVSPDFEPSSMLVFAALGVAAAIVGSALPAREAARAAPAAALKAGDVDAVATHARWPAWALMTLGAALTALPPVAGLPIFGYLAIAAIIVGGILAMPQVAHRVLATLPASRHVPVRLAIDYLRASPGRVAAMLAAMVASVSLMVAMAIMVASFRQSLEDWLTVMLPADLYARNTSDAVAFDGGDRAAIATLPGVERAEFMRATSIVLEKATPRVTLLARDIDPRDPGARLALVETAATLATDAPPAWISEAIADAKAVHPGDRITVPIGGRDVAFTVAGIWRDYVRQQGAIVVERSRYAAMTGDDAVNEVALWLASDADVGRIRDAIGTIAGGASQVTIATPGDLRRLSLAAFDRTFAVTYALEAAAVLIGLVGLSATLVAQTLARRREFGMLRHVGMTRGQLQAMVAVEGAVLAAIGTAAGLVLGFVISLILVHVVNRQSFHWGMDLHVPWDAIALLAVTLVVLATVTARAGARNATAIGAVRAVREDW
ncbi:MAG TPA: ABC transporter permease [Casimicrobiaceae bacterium]|nr:ABC transporter permease [Casimicrobiaceae bacterium]